MTTKVAICGANGRMGTQIIDEIRKVGNLELVAGFDVAGEEKALPGGVAVSHAIQAL